MPPRLEELQQLSSWKANDDDDTIATNEKEADNEEEKTNVVKRGIEKKKTNCRAVQFSDRVSVFEIENIDDPEERVAYWMVKEDYTNIRENCMKEVRTALQQCATTTSSNFRGLEHKTPQGLYRRFQSRQSAFKAVLDEQRRQKESGFSDPDWIAAVYREVCHRSLMDAKIMGMRDEVYMNHDSYVFYARGNLQDFNRQSAGESDTVEL